MFVNQASPHDTRPSPLEIILGGRRAAGCQWGLHLPGDEQRTTAAGQVAVLCLRISGENYGIDIMRIREVIKPRRVTEIPWTSSHVCGVISLRGTMVPVLDMSERLGVEPTPPTGRERVVVVKSASGLTGLRVDQVGQVIRIAKNDIQPPPLPKGPSDQGFVSGIARFDDRRIFLLNNMRVADMGAGYVVPQDPTRVTAVGP
jgi:purine-binding chemotaxis protein CheW